MCFLFRMKGLSLSMKMPERRLKLWEVGWLVSKFVITEVRVVDYVDTPGRE